MMRTSCLLIFAILISAPVLRAESRSESFDKDPAWEGFNNHVELKTPKNVEQDFGYRGDSNIAGKAKGEIGGTIWRSSTPASYADKITPRTLSDKLSASGTFAITRTDGSSGAFFGWFKADAPDAGRQNTLGLRLSGQGAGARLTLQLVTATNQACGTKITPWVVDKSKPAKTPERKYRPPQIKNDGTHYTWKLDYDPDANDGNGQMQFVIRSNSEHPDDWEGKTFTVNLPKGYKDQGTSFDRFGLFTSARPGNPIAIYFDDLEYDGKTQDFSTDPGWVGVGNTSKYEQHNGGGVHDFGYSESHNAGGAAAGEVGGTIWRSGAYGYYADHVGPLSLNDRLEASGKVILNVGPPDSGMYIGWFNGDEKTLSPIQAGQFVAAKIGGPTRVGHYFVPAYAAAQTKPPKPTGTREHPASIDIEKRVGPILTPQKVFDFKLVYDPAAADGKGEITATLGDESVTLPLKPGDKEKGAKLDHFGLFTTHRGGSFVKIYFDDLKYTATSPQ